MKFFKNIHLLSIINDSTTISLGQRIRFIDTAKGICIILVIILHSRILYGQLPELGLVRMPFYFTISGIFFKDYGGLLPTIIKKVNRLLVPFIFFYSVAYVIHIALAKITHNPINVTFFQFFDPQTKWMVNAPLWFLIALFWANILFYLLLKNIRNILFIGIITSIICLIAIRYTGCQHYPLPLFLDSAFACLPYYIFGAIIRRTKFLYPNQLDKFNILFILTLTTLAILVFHIGEKPYIDFIGVETRGNPFAFYVGSIVAVTALLLFCKTIGNIPIIQYFGRYSIIPLSVHIIIQETTKHCLPYLHLEFDKLTSEWITFIIVLISCFALIPVLKRYLPKFTAQEDLIPLDFLESMKKRLSRRKVEEPAG